MRHKYSPVILQTLGGSPQKDFEYEKKLQEYKEGKNRMVTIKKVIDSFPKKLEGYKQILDTIAGTCEYVFDKEQKGYCQFMHNISSSHKALSDKLITLFNQFGQLRNTTNSWIKEINDVSAKCRQREQCKKNYEHYEKKLYELNEDRIKEVKKKNKISESDHERFMRNIGKFQKAGKEYIYSSNSAFRAIEQFLNIRYDRILMAMVSFVEAERAFYNEASHIMNFFSNVRNNALGLKKTLIPKNTKYDASNFLKGRVIINMSAEEIFSSNYRPIPPPTGYGPGNNNYFPSQNQGMPGPGQSYNNNIQMNKGIINPFSSNNNEFENNNNANNNFGRTNTFPGNNAFNNRSTRDTFASSNPYNTQANPYSGNINNPMNSNNFGNQNMFNSNNNNFKNPYNSNNMQNDINPYEDNNNEPDPFSTNNEEFNDPYNNNDNINNIDGNNIRNPYGNNNSGPVNERQENNTKKEEDNFPTNNNNQNNNDEEDPFDF